MITPGSIVLTKKERRLAIRLLGLLQSHLEMDIDGGDFSLQGRDSRDLKATERMVKKLEAGLRG